MTGFVKQGGIWVPVTQPKVKNGGVWHDASKAYVKQGGTWKEWFSAAPLVTTPSAVKNFRIGPTNPSNGNITVSWDANDPSENVTEYWLYFANDYPNATGYTNASGAAATWAGAWVSAAPPAALGGYGRYQINCGNVLTKTLNWTGYTGGLTMWNSLRVIAKNSFGWGDQRSNLVFFYSTEEAAKTYNILPVVPPRLTGFVDPNYNDAAQSMTVDFGTGMTNNSLVNIVGGSWINAGVRIFDGTASSYRSAFTKTTVGSQTVLNTNKNNWCNGSVVAPIVYAQGLSTSGYSVIGTVYCGLRDGLYGAPATPNWRRLLPVPAANKIFNHTLVAQSNNYESGQFQDIGWTRAGWGAAGANIGSLTPQTVQSPDYMTGYNIVQMVRSGSNNSAITYQGAANMPTGMLMIGYGDEVNEYGRYTAFYNSTNDLGETQYYGTAQLGGSAQPEWVPGQTYNVRMYYY